MNPRIPLSSIPNIPAVWGVALGSFKHMQERKRRKLSEHPEVEGTSELVSELEARLFGAGPVVVVGLTDAEVSEAFGLDTPQSLADDDSKYEIEKAKQELLKLGKVDPSALKDTAFEKPASPVQASGVPSSFG